MKVAELATISGAARSSPWIKLLRLMEVDPVVPPHLKRANTVDGVQDLIHAHFGYPRPV
jgi:hypothetical protein